MPSLLVSLVLSMTLFCTASLAAPLQYNVMSFGAKQNGKTDSTKAFLAAWSKACASIKPATVYVPRGRFLVRAVKFEGPCKNNAIVVRIDGSILAPSDFRVIGDAGNWILFNHVDGLTVSGGVFDARGPGLWACKASGKNCLAGSTSLAFFQSSNVVISQLTSINSQRIHIGINGCDNVKIQGVTVSASGNSPNTDGIHVQLSSSVTILKTKIGTGDDCVSIGPGTFNMWIENIVCGPGHGISIGSLGQNRKEPGVQNVTVKSVRFIGTSNGVRIKSWGRPSNGFVRNVLFQHAVMTNVQFPIVIDQNYCPDNQDCPGKASGVKISDVTYQDIHGTSATKVAVKFDCSKKNPCTGIKLQDVTLSYKSLPANAFCSNADGMASGVVRPTSCL